MSRREDVLRVATELLAARMGSPTAAMGDLSRKEAVHVAVQVAEELVAEVDRRYPEELKRGGPEDR